MIDDPNRKQNQGTSQSGSQNEGSAQGNPSVEDVNRKSPTQDSDVETNGRQNRDEGERKAS
jgi:hypothetical protein